MLAAAPIVSPWWLAEQTQGPSVCVFRKVAVSEEMQRSDTSAGLRGVTHLQLKLSGVEERAENRKGKKKGEKFLTKANRAAASIQRNRQPLTMNPVIS